MSRRNPFNVSQDILFFKFEHHFIEKLSNRLELTLDEAKDIFSFCIDEFNPFLGKKTMPEQPVAAKKPLLRDEASAASAVVKSILEKKIQSSEESQAKRSKSFEGDEAAVKKTSDEVPAAAVKKTLKIDFQDSEGEKKAQDSDDDSSKKKVRKPRTAKDPSATCTFIPSRGKGANKGMCGKPALIGSERCSAHSKKTEESMKSSETVQDISDEDSETKKTPKRKSDPQMDFDMTESQAKILKTPPKATGFSYVSSANPELKEEQVVIRMLIDDKEQFVHKVSGFVFQSSIEKIVVGRLDKEKKTILPLTMEMIEEVQKYKLKHGPILTISSRHDVEKIRNELIEKEDEVEEEKREEEDVEEEEKREEDEDDCEEEEDELQEEEDD